MRCIAKIVTLLLLWGFAAAAHADIYWLDNQLDPTRPHYRTPEEACYLGVFKPQISAYRQAETNPNVRFRISVMFIGPDEGLGERVCRGDIERTYTNIWVTRAVVDTLVYGPNGGADACSLAGYSDPDTGQCGPPKCNGLCCVPNGCKNGSNPIQTASGNKHQVETDFLGTGPFPLYFGRTYNSNRTRDNNPAPIGVGWVHSYLRQIIGITTTGGAVDHAVIDRPDGRLQKFVLVGGIWQSDPDISERLQLQADGSGTPVSWTYTTNDDSLEAYDAEGRLTSITSRDGFVQTLSYTDAGNLPRDTVQKVTDPQGRTLTFGYNSTTGQLTSVTDGNGAVIQYGYDTGGNLQTTTYPDISGTKVRTYFYNETGQTGGASLPHALTGIQDENTQRFASWGYDSSGRATLSVHGPYTGGTIDRTSLLFNANGTTTITDGLGQARKFTFQTPVQYLVARNTILDTACDYCGTLFATRGYDSNGYPSTGTDFRGYQTTSTYTATDSNGHPRGLETQRDEAVGQAEERITNTAWNANFRVPDQRTVSNHSNTLETRTNWVYNTRGQPLARCDYDLTQSGASSYVCSAAGSPPAGIRRWVYTYCDAINLTVPDPIGSSGENLAKGCPLVGLIRRVDNPRPATDVNDWTTYQYYLANGAAYLAGDLAQVIDALGHVAQFVSYDGNGRATQTKDANGIATSMGYHPRGWLHLRTVCVNANCSSSPNDATTQTDYDGVGNAIKITQPDNVYLSYIFDNAHRLTKITDNLGNHIDYTLDALGHRTAEKTFDVSDAINPRRLLTRSYNALSRMIDQYDAQSRDTHFTYDGNGNRTDQTDPLSVKTHWDFDGLNRLKDQIGDYQGTDTSTKNSTIGDAYDTRDNVTQITDPNTLATNYTFDGLDDLKTLQSPDTGTTQYPSYDAAGNRLTQTDNRGVTWTMAYDALNRLIGTTYPTASLNVGYAYDSYGASNPCAATSYPIGRLASMTDSSGSTSYCYDLRGNITEKIQITHAYRFDTRYSYNSADRLMGITYPSGAQVAYTRDGDGRIQTVSVTPPGGGVTTILTSLTWQPFGPPITYTFAQGSQTLTKTFDQNYWMTDIVGSALNLHFCRDAESNITKLASASPACTFTSTEQYAYDALYRLVHVKDGTGNNLQDFTYNLTGDRLTKTLDPSPAQVYAYTPNTHQLDGVGANARMLDPNGNTTETTGSATLDYTFDNRNRMTAVKRNSSPITTYDYSARGERVYKSTTYPTNDTRWFSYSENGGLLGEYTASSQQEYVWADSTPVAILTTSGKPLTLADRIFANGFESPPTVASTIAYVHTDQLGSPRVLTTTSATNQWTWPWQTNPFGETAPTGAFTLNLRFPGQYADGETGLHYNGFRDFEPGIGRYGESDPVGLNGGISTYGYVGANPLGLFDPQGLGAENGMVCTPNGPVLHVGGDDSGGRCPQLAACLKAHEQCHVDDASCNKDILEQCSDPKNNGKPPNLPGWDYKKQTEVNATSCQIDCLDAALKHPDKGCKDALQRERDKIQKQHDQCKPSKDPKKDCNFQ